jgi:hypothetical protein
MAGHVYVPGTPTCHCDEAILHAPCAVCEAGPGAFQHLDAEPAPEVDVQAGDAGKGQSTTG